MNLAMRNSLAPHVDFQFLSGVIPENPKLMPCNIDMIIERKGKFFLGEWKNDGEKMSEGQRRTLIAFSENPNFSVYIIQGVSNHEKLEVGAICKLENKKLKLLGRGEDFLKRMIKAWYKHANYESSSGISA